MVKFLIIESGDKRELRIGYVMFCHAELIYPNEQGSVAVKGGGVVEEDPEEHKLILSGKSIQYGHPDFSKEITEISVGKAFEGWGIIYRNVDGSEIVIK